MGGRRECGQARPKLVAITGGSGSGKTFLAAMLEQSLQGSVLLLALDDFYRDRSRCHPCRRGRINFDHPRAMDWQELENVLKNLASGRPALAPRYNFATHTRHPARRKLRPFPVVLVEGLWPCYKKSVREMFAYRIFLDCPETVRLRRRMDRDIAERGRTAESVRQQFYQTVAPMHSRFVDPQRRWSDLVIRRPLAGRDIARLARVIAGLEQRKKETV